MTDPLALPSERHPDPTPEAEAEADAEIAELRQRVGRLERQLTQLVKTFSERLTEHGRRLDALDQPAQRRPSHDGG